MKLQAASPLLDISTIKRSLWTLKGQSQVKECSKTKIILENCTKCLMCSAYNSQNLLVIFKVWILWLRQPWLQCSLEMRLGFGPCFSCLRSSNYGRSSTLPLLDLEWWHSRFRFSLENKCQKLRKLYLINLILILRFTQSSGSSLCGALTFRLSTRWRFLTSIR